MPNEKLTVGWGKPYPSRKFHYFKTERSVCRAWGCFMVELAQGPDEHPDNCASCQRIRLAEKGNV